MSNESLIYVSDFGSPDIKVMNCTMLGIAGKSCIRVGAFPIETHEIVIKDALIAPAQLYRNSSRDGFFARIASAWTVFRRRADIVMRTAVQSFPLSLDGPEDEVEWDEADGNENHIGDGDD